MAEVEIIKRLQLIRTEILDKIIGGITHIGDEMFFIIVAVIVFWCVDKRFGYRLINVYLLGCVAIEGTKALVARPRPYTYEGVVSVGEKTSGFSFPSGHSHSIANLSTQFSIKYKKAFVIAIGAVLSLLVAFSRLYLGQHFLSDVIVGLSMGIGFAFLLNLAFSTLGNREEYAVLVILPVCAIVLLVLVLLGKADGASGALKVLGGYSAVSLGYFIEKRYICFETKGKWYIQIVKAIFGLIVTLAVKEGLKLVIPETQPVLYGFIRYFAVGITASVIVPLLFRLTRLSKSTKEKTTD